MRCDKLLVFALVLVLSLNLLSATIELGNISYHIDPSYSSQQPITGWVNLSLTNEPTSSLMSGFDTSLTIQSFLEKNNVFCSIVGPYECSCSPTDCKQTFSTNGSSSLQKTYPINIASTKLFGIKLTTASKTITSVTNFKFNVSTNAGESCINPLKIDLLDDNLIDWEVETISDEECFISKPYGCFNLEDVDVQAEIGTNSLCQKIIVPYARGFKIGAEINGTGSAGFTMTFDGTPCPNPISVSSGGEVSCIIDLGEVNTNTEAEVCIFANAGNTNDYFINSETNESCGYILDSRGDKIAGSDHDYEIFAKPLKYKPTSDFVFNQNLFDIETFNLNQVVFTYINDRYNGNCNPECIIPIRVYSGVDQDLTISDLLLDYNLGGQEETGSEEINFYDIKASPALMSSEFLKLNLLPANILTPTTKGEKDLVLKIGDKTITENISIINVPQIRNIIPTNPALLVPTTFIVILDQPITNRSNLTFIWDFGDNSEIQTTKKNSLMHTYTNLSTYQLKVNVSNKYGETSKTISIRVITPYLAINNTIKEYRKRLRTVNNKFIALPQWIKSLILVIKNIEDLKSDVDRLESQYRETLRSEDEELVKIMQDLTALNIPSKFDTPLEIKPIKFIQNKDRLDLSVLEGFDAGRVELGRNKNDYDDAINRWLNQNLDISFQSKTHYFYYEDETEQVLLSHVKLTLSPKKDIEEFYMIISGPTNNIKFKKGEDYGEKELPGGYGIRFPTIIKGQNKTIEFTYPETVELTNPPIYVSPRFRNLELGVEPGICNNNNICEPNLKENYKNCRVDCKPTALTILFLGILLFIAFIVYIILQEWYKRYYESNLFKDKNQLFNLVTFMSTSVNQKLTRSQTFAKLKPVGWSKGQLVYAWKKLHGKRTGMFEIPIFLPFEKAKIKGEIAKRSIRQPPRFTRKI